MAFERIIFPLHCVQLLFALIILGLTAYLASVSNQDFGFEVIHYSFSQINFMIFNSVFTLIGLAYLILSPRLMPSLAHKFALLAVNAILCLFWFSGFIALAVILVIFFGSGYSAGAAACAFGAFEWLLFIATTVLTALTVFGHGSKTTNNSDGIVV